MIDSQLLQLTGILVLRCWPSGGVDAAVAAILLLLLVGFLWAGLRIGRFDKLIDPDKLLDRSYSHHFTGGRGHSVRRGLSLISPRLPDSGMLSGDCNRGGL